MARQEYLDRLKHFRSMKYTTYQKARSFSLESPDGFRRQFRYFDEKGICLGNMAPVFITPGFHTFTGYTGAEDAVPENQAGTLDYLKEVLDSVERQYSIMRVHEKETENALQVTVLYRVEADDRDKDFIDLQMRDLLHHNAKPPYTFYCFHTKQMIVGDVDDPIELWPEKNEMPIPPGTPWFRKK